MSGASRRAARNRPTRFSWSTRSTSVELRSVVAGAMNRLSNCVGRTMSRSDAPSTRRSYVVSIRLDATIPSPVDAFPWGSRSTIKTRFFNRASAAPRLIAVVVLPTPPFWFVTARIRVRCSGMGQVPDAEDDRVRCRHRRLDVDLHLPVGARGFKLQAMIGALLKQAETVRSHVPVRPLEEPGQRGQRTGADDVRALPEEALRSSRF
jgi:hypothetical protein